MGAQIRKVFPQGSWIDDSDNDKVVTLKSGTLEASKEYGRSFEISPYASYGTYDANWVVLNHKTGSWYDNAERHSAFMIEEPILPVIPDPTPTPEPTPTPAPTPTPTPMPTPTPEPTPTPTPPVIDNEPPRITGHTTSAAVPVYTRVHFTINASMTL